MAGVMPEGRQHARFARSHVEVQHHHLLGELAAEARYLLWLAVLKESSKEVQAFRRRPAGGHPANYLLYAPNTIHAFELEFNQGIHDVLVVCL